MRRLLRLEVLVPVAALAAFLLIFGPLGGVAGVSLPARALAAGALLAPAVMVYAHRTAAAGAAAAAAVLWSTIGGSLAITVVVWGYAATAVLVARRDRPVAATAVPHRRPPRPAGALPRVAVAAEVAGYVLIAGAAAGFGTVGGAWIALLVPAGGLGLALAARAVRARRALHDLFGTGQSARAVRVVEQLGYVHVLLPAEDGQSALEFGFDVADPGRPQDPGRPETGRPADGSAPEDEDEPHTRPGVLFGEPRPGAWCAVEVQGRLHVPAGPVGEVISVPYDEVQGLPREVEDDEEQLVDPAALRPGDRGVGAFQPREHRISPQRAWVATVAIGFGSALAAGELIHLAGRPPAMLTGVLIAIPAAAGYEFGWRTQLRPRLRWHAGGVATVGFRGPDRQPWATDSAVVHDDEGTVLLTAGESVLTVPVPAPWPSGAAQRDAAQLVAALRVARTQSFEADSPLPPPPEIEVPRRPGLLYPAWLLSVTVALVILT